MMAGRVAVTNDQWTVMGRKGGNSFVLAGNLLPRPGGRATVSGHEQNEGDTRRAVYSLELMSNYIKLCYKSSSR